MLDFVIDLECWKLLATICQKSEDYWGSEDLQVTIESAEIAGDFES